MRRARYHSLSALAAFALLGPGCGFDIVSQETLGGVVVATVHSPTADFARYKTFAIVDKVGLVTDDVGVTVKYVDAPAVLAQITADLDDQYRNGRLRIAALVQNRGAKEATVGVEAVLLDDAGKPVVTLKPQTVKTPAKTQQNRLLNRTTDTPLGFLTASDSYSRYWSDLETHILLMR